jgi:hypothetical protein
MDTSLLQTEVPRTILRMVVQESETALMSAITTPEEVPQTNNKFTPVTKL